MQRRPQDVRAPRGLRVGGDRGDAGDEGVEAALARPLDQRGDLAVRNGSGQERAEPRGVRFGERDEGVDPGLDPLAGAGFRIAAQGLAELLAGPLEDRDDERTLSGK
jgi:hypothetical protein